MTQTHSNATATPLPQLHDVVQDLMSLWSEAKQAGRESEARDIIAQYPGAREDLQKALACKHALDAMLHPQDDPFAPADEDPFGTSAVACEAQEAPQEHAAEASDDAPQEEAGSEAQDAAEPDEPGEESEPATPESSDAAPSTAQAYLGDLTEPTGGLFGHLHACLGDGNTLTLHVARNADTLIISVIPQAVSGEQPASVRSFTVTDTPAALDAEFVSALGIYSAGRRGAIQAAREALAAQLAATKAAAAKKTSTPAKPTQTTKPAAKKPEAKRVEAKPPAPAPAASPTTPDTQPSLLG